MLWIVGLKKQPKGDLIFGTKIRNEQKADDEEEKAQKTHDAKNNPCRDYYGCASYWSDCFCNFRSS